MNKKFLSAAVTLALAAGISGTALAAEGSLADVPKDHWSYAAIDMLVQDGIVEGNPDGTFQGGRTMTRYEMASIVARAVEQSKAGDLKTQALVEKLQAEYSSEISTLQADVKALKENAEKVKFSGMFRVTYDHDDKADKIERWNDRFYMDLHADYKVNEHWTAKFQSETNHKSGEGHSDNVKDAYGNHSSQGTIQRIWAEGNFDNGAWVNVGRTWRGLGFTNILQGGETDGVQAGVPIKGTGLTASAYYWAHTGLNDKQSFYGVGTWGSIGHAVDINAAYQKTSVSKGNNTSDDGTDAKAIAKYDNGFVVGAKVKAIKNVTLTGEYIQTNADNSNKAAEARIDYKGTNLQDPGSFGVYARYFKIGDNAGSADDEWGSRPAGNKGWMLGFKYVPSKNVEWHTMYSQQKKDFANKDFDRNLFRTEVDFHF